MIYEEKIQYKEILNKLLGLHQLWQRENKEYERIDLYAKGFAIDLNYYKNPGFFEEQEVWIVRLVVEDPERDYYRDVGDNSELKEILPLEVKKRRKDGEEIIYLELPIEISGRQIIQDVILGPKCKTNIEKIQKDLNDSGLSDVTIRRSKISYR